MDFLIKWFELGLVLIEKSKGPGKDMAASCLTITFCTLLHL